MYTNFLYRINYILYKTWKSFMDVEIVAQACTVAYLALVIQTLVHSSKVNELVTWFITHRHGLQATLGTSLLPLAFNQPYWVFQDKRWGQPTRWKTQNCATPSQWRLHNFCNGSHSEVLPLQDPSFLSAVPACSVSI